MTHSSVDASEVAKFQALAKTWWDKTGPFQTLHEINPPRLALIEKYGPLKGSRCLDVGCGGGILAESLASLGASVTGLDMSDEVIRVAKAHAKEQKLVIDYQVSAIETFEAAAFDSVMCLEMLEHVTEPKLVLEHCARLLKPGGFLFLSTINRTIQAYLTAIVAAEYVFKLLPRQTHDYDKCIKPSELSMWVRETGLEVVELTGLGYNPFTHRAYLQSSVNVNYLLVCQKPIS